MADIPEVEVDTNAHGLACQSERQSNEMHTSEFPPVAVDLVPVEAVQPEAPRAPSFGPKRALWIMLSYILTQLGVVFLIGVAFGLADEKFSVGPMIVATMVGALVGTAVAWRMVRTSFASEPLQAFEDAIAVRSGTPRQVAIAAAAGLLLSALNGLLLIRVFPPSSTQELGLLVAAMNEGGRVRHACTVFGVFVAPATEEFIFRGVLFSGLARRLPAPWAASLSIGAFVLMHVSSASPYWPGLVSVSLLAMAAQVARMRTGSLVPGIAMHAVYNMALFGVGYLR